MSKYMKLTEKEALPIVVGVNDIEVEALKEKVLIRMKEEDAIMKKQARNSKLFKRVVAAIVVFGIATPAGVYAAGKLGVFDGLFGNKDSAPIEQYVESTDTEQYGTKIYQMENNDYSIVVDSFVYSEVTDYGIVQFTVTDKNTEGDDWYDVATWDEWYSDWNVWETTEIFAGVGDKRLWFEVNGLLHQNNRCFMKKIDEQTVQCYLCFNDMKNSYMADKNLQLSVKESEITKQGERETLSWTQIMKLDVPMGESVPGYTWYNEAGGVALTLTSVDFWLIDAPESSVSGNDIILKEISVQLKDGSQYIVHSEKQKIIDWFYSAQRENGIWRNFASVINLEEVTSFTVDGKLFFVEDAVQTGI